jgi:hypothetical protein
MALPNQPVQNTHHLVWDMSSHLLVKGVLVMLGSLIWAVVIILVVLWLLGWLAFHVGGGLIHILIVVAIIVLLFNLFVGRRGRRL